MSAPPPGVSADAARIAPDPRGEIGTVDEWIAAALEAKHRRVAAMTLLLVHTAKLDAFAARRRDSPAWVHRRGWRGTRAQAWGSCPPNRAPSRRCAKHISMRAICPWAASLGSQATDAHLPLRAERSGYSWPSSSRALSGRWAVDGRAAATRVRRLLHRHVAHSTGGRQLPGDRSAAVAVVQRTPVSRQLAAISWLWQTAACSHTSAWPSNGRDEKAARTVSG